MERNELDHLIGKWSWDHTYERDDLPPWCYGDPWMCQYFICGVDYYIENNAYQVFLTDHPPKRMGETCATIRVVMGHAAKKIMEKHGGTLNIQKLRPTDWGWINDVVLIDGGIYSAYGIEHNGMEQTERKLTIVDGSPEWFKFIKGQQTLF